MSKFPMFQHLENALLDRAEAMSKKSEMQAFIARMQKECPNWIAYEKALVFAYTDGLAYGNWPWEMNK